MNSKNKFKIGLFGINSDSGLSLTTHKKKWKANWNDIKELVIFCDKNKFDFILPLSKWQGWGGASNPNNLSYETFNFAAILLNFTKNLYFYSTIHIPFVHPVYTARSISTISSFFKGRIGINIVCGWNNNEYKMFYNNITPLNDERYKFGEEWVKVFKSLLNNKNKKTSFKGKFFDIKSANCEPKSYEQPYPNIVSAAYSQEGRKFAIKNCDTIFTMFDNLEKTKKINSELISKAKQINKRIKIFTPIHIIARNTASEANEFHEEYSQLKIDDGATRNFIKNVAKAGKNPLYKIMLGKKNLIASSCGSKIIKGSFRDVSEQLREVKKANFNGAAFSFVDYLEEVKNFHKHVLKKKVLD
jgi:FMNH2-dependent dimethyl sulfone monooxygenase